MSNTIRNCEKNCVMYRTCKYVMIMSTHGTPPTNGKNGLGDYYKARTAIFNVIARNCAHYKRAEEMK